MGRRGSKDLRKSVIALRRMNSEAQESLLFSQRQIDRDGNVTENGERRDGNSGESGKGHKRFLSLGEDEGEEKENGGFEDAGLAGDRERERERSETSLAFERVLGGGGSAADRNVFGIADEMDLQKGKGERWSGGLYDENGFLRDGGRSPGGVSFGTVLQ